MGKVKKGNVELDRPGPFTLFTLFIFFFFRFLTLNLFEP